ncbi:MAG: VCBS repeat domain-containing M23 family metallopeptidase [Solirubrobacteraceae bacterium]
MSNVNHGASRNATPVGLWSGLAAPLLALALVLVLIFAAAPIGADAKEPPRTGAATLGSMQLRTAVQVTLNRSWHRPARSKVRLSFSRVVGRWALGSARVPHSSRSDGPPVPVFFIAHRLARKSSDKRGRASEAHMRANARNATASGAWQVGVQGSALFARLVMSAPASVVPPATRNLYVAMPSNTPQPAFALPWAAGQTWQLWFGPHNTDSDFRAFEYTSLDFAGGDGIVRAAAAGVVYRPCANLVVIDHGGGWETGYYHLPTSSIVVHAGQVVNAGDALGTIGTATGCGGEARGAHVHFSIYHFSTSGVQNVFKTPSTDINGDVIGGWVVHTGSAPGHGYMQRIRDGLVVYPTDFGGTGAILNDGTVSTREIRPPSGSTFVMPSMGGGFSAPQQWANVPFFGTKATLAGDVNGDGKTDLIAVNDAGTWVLGSNGYGAFSAPQQWANVPFFGTKATLAGDVNGDSKTDLIAVNYDPGG